MTVITLIHAAFVSCIYIHVIHGYQKGAYNKNSMKIVFNKLQKFQYPVSKTDGNEVDKIENIYNSINTLSKKNDSFYKKQNNLLNTKQSVAYKIAGKNNNLVRLFLKENSSATSVISRKRRTVENNYNKSEIPQKLYENLKISENEFTIEDVNLNLNWMKLLNINKLGYRLSLAINGKEEGKFIIVGDSKPEYTLNRLKPNSSYTINIMPVSCKLQVEFQINTPRLISYEETISLINMIHREEKNLTNVRNVAITFKNSIENITGYILEVELLTRYNEGSKTVVVQIVNLVSHVKMITVDNLKPCSIYKFNIHKEDRETLELSRAFDSIHTFYVFTGNTDNFKSNIPFNNKDFQDTNIMYGSLEKHAHLKSKGVMPRRTVTCYVDNETPFPGFACRNSDICIPMNWVCDEEEDCQDGDDELNCRGHIKTDHYERNFCRKNEFRCYSRGEYSCLPTSWLCDGRRDCEDGWDENTINCRRTFNRPGSTYYNTNSAMCDRDYFRCFNGLGCVAPSFVCDGDQDCSDGSDEWRCKTNSRCNSRYEFQCFYEDTPYSAYSTYRNHRCIPKSWVCDDQDDCPNGEDESFETCNLVRRLGTTTGLFSVINKIVDPSNYF